MAVVGWLAAQAATAALASGTEPGLDAETVLAATIAYHDPQDAWSTRELEIVTRVELADRLAQERGYRQRTDRMVVDNAIGAFRLISENDQRTFEIYGHGDVLKARLNGSDQIDDAARAQHRLTPAGMIRWRNYFTYMLGLPMKLRDPGTQLDPQVRRVQFDGREALALRVTYSPEVGRDVWLFYVDPRSHALMGCRFYHDESVGDGEFLTFDGEVSGPQGLRLPKRRRWHMNRDGEHIADDVVVSIR